MKKIFKFTNNFHNSEVNLRLTQIDDIRWFISKHQAKKAYNALCGISGCTCGGTIGERPLLDIVPCGDGFIFYNR